MGAYQAVQVGLMRHVTCLVQCGRGRTSVVSELAQGMLHPSPGKDLKEVLVAYPGISRRTLSRDPKEVFIPGSLGGFEC